MAAAVAAEVAFFFLVKRREKRKKEKLKNETNSALPSNENFFPQRVAINNIKSPTFIIQET
jgi:hypothetical protein